MCRGLSPGWSKACGRYFFFLVFFLGGLGAGFFAGLGAGLDFCGGFALGSGFATAGAGATGAGGTALPFFPFGPGLAACAAVAAAAAASAAAFAARPLLGAGGGGGGGGANGFKYFSVSVRERSLPSSRSMKTSCASLG